MSLIIVFHNDSTGTSNKGNYNVTTYINKRSIWTGRIEAHDRREGWEKLVKMLAEQFDNE